MKLSIPCFVLLLLAAGCSDSNKSSSGTTNTSGGVMSAPGDYGNALANSQARAIKTVDVASLNSAVQMFNVQEGRYPKDLNELVGSKLISRIPDAPQGMKIDYDPATGKVSVVKE